jgi:ornithine lipid hydroxylase
MNTPLARRPLQVTVAVSLFPLALLFSLGGLALAWQQGWSAEAVLTLTGVVTLLGASWLERRMPLRADWNQPVGGCAAEGASAATREKPVSHGTPSCAQGPTLDLSASPRDPRFSQVSLRCLLPRSLQGDTATDWTSLIALVGLADPLARWLVPILAVVLYQTLDHAPWTGLSELSLTAQVVVVTLLAELGKYASHRWHHSNRRLWWLHALHHSSERLYALNNFRFHPLNHVINHLIGLGPVMVLGASPEALLVYLALSQPVLMLQHANLPLKQGFLNLVFSTNEAHRTHHSTARHEGDRNFGSALLLWDHVFGTYRRPNAADERLQVGIYQPGRYPARASYLQQLASMFGRDCCPA